MAVKKPYPENYPEPDPAALERTFQELAAQWRQETRFTSSASALVNHPAYRRIIALGIAVVPFILRELTRQPDHWFRALTEITGENPVPAEDEGNLVKMTEDWLRYGRQKGYCL